MRSCGASHWLRMSQSEAEDEQLLGGIQEGDDPMDEGSEHGSESEDESDDANAGERWLRSLMKRVLQLPEVSLMQLWSKITFAEERENAYKDALKRFTEQCAAGALAGKTKLKHKVEVLRTQLEARTAQADAAISKNRVIVAKCEGLQNAFKQEKDMKEALQYDCNRLEAENTELKTQMAAKDESIAVLSRTIGEQQDRITELTGQVGMYKGKVIATAMGKPDSFDGKGLLTSKGAQQVEDWFLTVKRYVDNLSLSGSDAVGVAVSMLKGEAARAWSGHEAIMQAENKEISLADVKLCLMQRFTPASTAWQARMDLDALLLGSKGCKTLAQYVTEFDRLCSLIPDLEPGERKHRFRTGIQRAGNQQLFRQCCMDPTTSAPFETYERMRAATLNASLHSAECITRIDDARTHLALQHSGGQRRHSDGGGGKQQQHGNKGHPGAGTSKAGSGSGGKEAAGSGSKGSAGSGSSKGAVAGQKRPYRSDAVFTYCKKNGMCLNCYGKHKASTCTAQEAEGFPPGYSAE